MILPIRLATVSLLLISSPFSLVGGETHPESALGPHEPWLDGVSDSEAVGQVRDVKGMPVAQARIRLMVDGQLRTLTTDAKGCFRFADPHPGVYRFEIEGDGFESLQRTIQVRKGQQWPRLRFILRTMAGAVVEVTSGLAARVAPRATARCFP